RLGRWRRRDPGGHRHGPGAGAGAAARCRTPRAPSRHGRAPGAAARARVRARRARGPRSPARLSKPEVTTARLGLATITRSVVRGRWSTNHDRHAGSARRTGARRLFLRGQEATRTVALPRPGAQRVQDGARGHAGSEAGDAARREARGEMRGWIILIGTLLVGAALGIAATIYVPPRPDPYLHNDPPLPPQVAGAQ